MQASKPNVGRPSVDKNVIAKMRILRAVDVPPKMIAELCEVSTPTVYKYTTQP